MILEKDGADGQQWLDVSGLEGFPPKMRLVSFIGACDMAILFGMRGFMCLSQNDGHGGGEDGEVIVDLGNQKNQQEKECKE
ncbi:unnamed protein product [Sphenostylis stenocarpa]|uniref:Uncharacterized protein n=1 Tax=Sphenostylis stenocarpa TaxID=92480 RepID=A0AA86V1F0_9FABA|nr:unnamed protein product [Sphenostylis stenocarpa]